MYSRRRCWQLWTRTEIRWIVRTCDGIEFVRYNLGAITGILPRQRLRARRCTRAIFAARIGRHKIMRDTGGAKIPGKTVGESRLRWNRGVVSREKRKGGGFIGERAWRWREKLAFECEETRHNGEEERLEMSVETRDVAIIWISLENEGNIRGAWVNEQKLTRNEIIDSSKNLLF